VLAAAAVPAVVGQGIKLAGRRRPKRRGATPP